MVAAVTSFLSISTCLNYSPVYQFFLHSHVNLSRNDLLVLYFNIILWNGAGVLNSALIKKISGVTLLKKGATDVFLVSENLVGGTYMLSGFI